jgi:hypothetical protein
MRSADELIEQFSDTNLQWESMMTRELAEEILGRTLTLEDWQIIIDALDDTVYETMMSFQ